MIQYGHICGEFLVDFVGLRPARNPPDCSSLAHFRQGAPLIGLAVVQDRLVVTEQNTFEAQVLGEQSDRFGAREPGGLCRSRTLSGDLLNELGRGSLLPHSEACKHP